MYLDHQKLPCHQQVGIVFVARTHLLLLSLYPPPTQLRKVVFSQMSVSHSVQGEGGQVSVSHSVGEGGLHHMHHGIGQIVRVPPLGYLPPGIPYPLWDILPLSGIPYPLWNILHDSGIPYPLWGTLVHLRPNSTDFQWWSLKWALCVRLECLLLVIITPFSITHKENIQMVCFDFHDLIRKYYIMMYMITALWLQDYRSGTVNSKSFVSKVLLRIKWKFELTVHFKHEMIVKNYTETLNKVEL